MRRIILYLLLSLCYAFVFSQINVEKFRPPIQNESDLDSVQVERTPDSTYIVTLNNAVLDSVIRGKISYLQTAFRGHFKNISISFRNKRHYDYIEITGNLPITFIERRNKLVGTMVIEDFRLFIYNNTCKSLDKYFSKTNVKYFMPIYEYSDMVINTPSWYYLIKDDSLEEVCNE